MIEDIICGAIGAIIGTLYTDHLYKKRLTEYENKLQKLFLTAQMAAKMKASGRWR